MQVLFLNNDGGGFADHVEVTEGMTVTDFLADRLPGRDLANYLIRVNRQPVAKDYILQHGDRVTATPVKIEGATAA